ncbi:hypothetical protein ABR772_25835 [Bacillus cereus]|uniref:hypothetical protein n=1 Tax=Bacillus cereus TaxID=1396 RepID=UPI0035581572
MIKVIVPNKGYNAEFAGVHFVNGVGLFEDEALGKQIAADFGYEIEAEVKEAKPKKVAAKAKKAGE